MKYVIIHSSESLLAINKPAGTPSHRTIDPSRENATDVINAARREQGLQPLILLHRLDQEASGILLFAQTSDAAKIIQRDFAAHRIMKTYFAVVRGRWQKGNCWLRTRISEKPDREHRHQVLGNGGKLAISWVAMLRELGENSLLQVNPLSGRTHQIRAQLSHYGHPIVGDRLYGGKLEATDRTTRLMLHAYRMELPKPSSEEKLILQASLFEDMIRCIGVQLPAPLPIPPLTDRWQMLEKG